MPPRWTEFRTDLAIKPCFITSYHRHLKQIFDICWKKLFGLRRRRCAPFLIGISFHISKISQNWNWKLIRNTRNRFFFFFFYKDKRELIDVFITMEKEWGFAIDLVERLCYLWGLWRIISQLECRYASCIFAFCLVFFFLSINND